MASNVTSFYSHVVQNVIQNLRSEFDSEGLDESVIEELQSLWEAKLKSANIFPADYKRPAPTTPAPDLNLDPTYEGEGYVDRPVYEGEVMTPTAEMLFSPMPYTPKPGAAATPLGQTPPVSTPFYNTPEDQGNYSQLEPRRTAEDGTGRSPLFMPGNFVSRDGPYIDMNVAYVDNRDEVYGQPPQGLPETKDYMGVSSTNKRKRDFQNTFPQTDGSGDVSNSFYSMQDQDYLLGDSGTSVCIMYSDYNLFLRTQDVNEERKHADDAFADMLKGRNPRSISQLDGIDDNYENVSVNHGEIFEILIFHDVLSLHRLVESILRKKITTCQLKKVQYLMEVPMIYIGMNANSFILDLGREHDSGTKPAKEEGSGESDDSEPPLNEDDDDDDVNDFGDGDEASKTEDLILAQFEKVTKVKGKWKCILKDGVMRLNNKDFLFSKATGEFDFF